MKAFFGRAYKKDSEEEDDKDEFATQPERKPDLLSRLCTRQLNDLGEDTWYPILMSSMKL